MMVLTVMYCTALWAEVFEHGLRYITCLVCMQLKGQYIRIQLYHNL